MHDEVSGDAHRGAQQQHETGTFAGHPFLKVVSG